jgi:hypothetical protein
MTQLAGLLLVEVFCETDLHNSDRLQVHKDNDPEAIIRINGDRIICSC